MSRLLSAWDRTPEDLRALGYARDPRHLFGRLQRVHTWVEGRPALARAGRELVDGSLDLSLPELLEAHPSGDGSTRLVLGLADGERIEAVHMPRATRNPRVTICLSSQVGCALGCTFCATARMGLRRQLRAHEIVGQLLAVLQRLGPRSPQELTLVFMGMGEPLANVEALLRALDVLCDPAGMGLCPARITVSTAGHLPGLRRLAASPHRPALAVSVNAATERLRRSLMPVSKKWPLSELRAALVLWPLAPRERLTLEYVLLADVNDSVDDADRLAAWIGDLRHVVNVIPFNVWGGVDDTEQAGPYREPSAERILAFTARLRSHGSFVTVRKSRGRDARGACGTLAVVPTTD